MAEYKPALATNAMEFRSLIEMSAAGFPEYSSKVNQKYMSFNRIYGKQYHEDPMEAHSR